MKNYLTESDPDFPLKKNFKLSMANQNGRSQNGAIDNYPPISNGTFVNYKTFKNFVDPDTDKTSDYTVKSHDLYLAASVMIFGIAATIIATYSSWAYAITSASFSEPCLLNTTAAARSIIDSISNI